MNENESNINDDNKDNTSKLNRSTWYDTEDDFDKQSIWFKIGGTLGRWGRNAWRGIAYVVKKPCNALSKGFSKAWNATWGNIWESFKNGCSEGWRDIKFKQSRYGLYEVSKEEGANNNLNLIN